MFVDNIMKQKILGELKKIEDEEKVKIIYACESGSRAWGFPSKDSDYDVRFIYVHDHDRYLSVYDRKDVIERPVCDLLDINGWDIRKALRLLQKSNAALMEWFQSPVIYLDRPEISKKIKELIPAAFSQKSTFHHYSSIVKSTFRDSLQGESVKIKKYFYALRPALACRWIEERKTVPPMEFNSLLTILPEGVLKNEIHKLLNEKIYGEETDLKPKIPIINEYLEQEITHFA
ncbi:MAG: nucleotidyltransferase domain-containing protein, partial [Candidatus Eremiobacterota bacterium]